MNELANINFVELLTNPQAGIIPVLLFIGAVLKKSKRVSDNLIPIILAVLGAVMGYIFVEPNANGILVGFLYASTAVAGYTGTKQLITKKEDEEIQAKVDKALGKIDET